jgi:hypothetical protein
MMGEQIYGWKEQMNRWDKQMKGIEEKKKE